MEPTEPTIQWVPGIRRPKRETENEQWSSTNRKNDRVITPNCVLLQVVYSTVELSRVGKNRDVRYGNSLKTVRNLRMSCLV